MKTYTVEIIEKSTGIIVRRVTVEASGQKGARFYAFATYCTDSETVGHAFLGE
jgi:hypothetical protein